MKPLRLALFLILLVFHATLVILSLNFSQSIADGIIRNPTAFRFLAFFGLVVFLVTFAFAWFDRRTARKRIQKLEAEKNAIKADVFDREQRAKEREREIEHEIESFEKSLPSTGSKSGTPVLPPAEEDTYVEPNPNEPQLSESFLADSETTEPDLTESDPTESRPTESSPTESHLTDSHQTDYDEVEYGPLVPREPTPDEDADPDDTTPQRS